MTNSFGPVDPAELHAVQAATSKKHGWLPLLTVLFLLSYGLMTMLIVEQGRTIESQRALIQVLFHDSTELSAVKMKAHHQLASETQAAASQNPSSQKQSIQVPSTQAPTQQAPSTQAGSQHRSQVQEKQKPFRMPSRPASDLTDARRALISI